VKRGATLSNNQDGRTRDYLRSFIEGFHKYKRGFLNGLFALAKSNHHINMH